MIWGNCGEINVVTMKEKKKSSTWFLSSLRLTKKLEVEISYTIGAQEYISIPELFLKMEE